MDESNLIIDAVLNTAPLEPTPLDFTARVMAEIRTVNSAPQPRQLFRLDFVDFALPVFFALFSAGLVGLNLVAVFSVDKLTRMKLELQGKMLLVRLLALPNQFATYKFPMAAWLPVMVIGMVSLFGLLVVVCVWSLQRPMNLVEK